MKQMVDLIFYASKLLHDVEEMAEKSHYIGHGVDPIFLASDTAKVPDDIADIPKPIVGFHGVLEFHIDAALLKYLFIKHPKISFVFIGPVNSKKKTQYLKEFTNFHMLGQKEFNTLPGYLNYFDVAILPYETNPWTYSCSPLKLYEYLAVGLPTVSVDLPEIQVHKQFIHIANGFTEFSDMILTSLSNESDRAKQKDYAANHLWQNKVDRMLQIMQDQYRKKVRSSLNPDL